MEAKRILVPVDFSEMSSHALDAALKLARVLNAQVDVLHVVPHTIALSSITSFAQSDVDGGDVAMEAARSRMDGFLGSRSPNQARVVAGDKPAETIVKEAKSASADLIVIATHGYSGLKRLVLGSTAEEVIRTAVCPVLVIPRLQSDRRTPKSGP